MPHEIQVVMERINNYVNIFSIIGIFAAIGIILYLLLKKTNKWERLLLGVIFISSGLMRFIFGSFAPWRQHDHHVDILMNLKNNLSETGLFSITEYYHASGGLFEMFYDIPLQILGEFNVYTVYYTSLAIHLIAGLLVFKLALALFKKKEVAFISYLMFAFLPILIDVSATELLFHINVLTVLLFSVYGLHLFKKIKSGTDKWWDYAILSALFASNLMGRTEYLMIFLGVIFIFALFLIATSSKIRKIILTNKKVQLFTTFSGVLILFAFFNYLLPTIMSPGEFSYRWGNFIEFRHYLNSLRYTSYNIPSYGLFLRSFFTPLYFFSLLLIAPIILILKKKWSLLLINFVSVLLLMFLMTPSLGEFRRAMPLLIFFIPQMGYGFYHLLSDLNLSAKNILILSSFIIILSTYQNLEFLKMETARKTEQELILEFMDEAPENSLVLTINNSKDYRYMQHGNSFDAHLVPGDKNIDVVDLYTEYNPEMLKDYDNLFYYRSLYSYHESNWQELLEKHGDAYVVTNESNMGPYEVSRKFEKNNSLKLIKKGSAPNRLTDTSTVSGYINGTNGTILTDYDLLEIGFYRIEN